MSATGKRATAASHARLLLFAFFAVVAAFWFSTAYTVHVMNSLRRQTETMRSQALPAFAALSDLRSDLRRVEVEAEHVMDLRTEVLLEDQSRAAIAAATARMNAARARLDDHVRRYASVLSIDGDHALAETVAASAAELHPILSRAEDIAATATDAQRVALARELHAGVDRGEDSLVLVFRDITDRSHQLMEEIDAVRMDARHRRYALDALATIVAFAVGVLALRSFRRHEALADEHDRILEARALELEGFASRVAHDIRGPLGAAMMSFELVDAKAGADAATHKTAMRGRDALMRASRVVDALLEFARAAMAPSEPGVCQLRPTLESLADDARSRVASKDFHIEVEPFEDAAVACSEGVLLSVVSNLLDNALRYTADSPTHEIRLRALTSGCRIRVEVDDSGPGIHVPCDLLFLPHVRGERAVGDGMGLGLATVKRLVEAHGGQVGAADKPDAGGSIFWFELPRAAPQPQRAALVS